MSSLFFGNIQRKTALVWISVSVKYASLTDTFRRLHYFL